jgi:MFS family permease
MMAGVNNQQDYYENVAKFGYKDPQTGAVVVTDALLQGGIVSVYYLGTLVGALVGGKVGDRFGRIKAIGFGCIWAIIGASLQTSAQNHNWMICARLINGWGTGILNSIVPVYATETAEHTSRGQFVAIEFTLNIFGVSSNRPMLTQCHDSNAKQVVVAYWLEYGCSFVGNGDSPFSWRFPIGFQIILLLLLFAGCWFFPESPR